MSFLGNRKNIGGAGGGEGGEGDDDEVGEGGGDANPVVIFRVFGMSAPRSFSGVASRVPRGEKIEKTTIRHCFA